MTITTPSSTTRLLTLTADEAALLVSIENAFGSDVVRDLVVNWITGHAAQSRQARVELLLDETKEDVDLSQQLETLVALAETKRSERDDEPTR